jgi:hypothetical protein
MLTCWIFLRKNDYIIFSWDLGKKCNNIMYMFFEMFNGTEKHNISYFLENSTFQIYYRGKSGDKCPNMGGY